MNNNGERRRVYGAVGEGYSVAATAMTAGVQEAAGYLGLAAVDGTHDDPSAQPRRTPDQWFSYIAAYKYDDARAEYA